MGAGKHGRAKAWHAFKEPIERVINTVDQGAQLVEREFDDGRRLLASPAAGIPFGPHLNLTFSFHLEHVKKDGDHRMTTRRYTFTVAEQASGNRVFAWHWHPHSRRSKVRYPHVHIPQGSAYSTSHVPTGRVCLEDVILFGFEDLSVPATVQNAEQIVIDVRDRHKKHRGWH